MGKGVIILVFIALVVVGTVLIGIFLFFDSGPDLSSEELEKCTVLKKSSSDSISIVFFSESKSGAEKYMDFFLTLEPFKENPDKFSFYYIGGYAPKCELYKGIALLCYSKEAVQKSASCPNDQIVVINDDFDRSIRSSSYLNIMSINAKHPLTVLQHEFGHSFVNLAEEYVPASIPRNSAGNCVGKCESFEGRNDGCFKGCSREDYQRSIDNGVMRTLQSNLYGTFNKYIIGKKMDSLVGKSSKVTGKAIDNPEDCLKEGYYLIEGNVDEDVNIKGKSFEKGCFGDPGAGGYSLDVVLEGETKVFTGNFNPEEIFTSAPGDYEIDGDIYKSDIDFFIKAPVIEGAKSLEVSDPEGKVIASIPVCEDKRGDANGDGEVDLFDVAHLNAYLLGEGLNCKKNSDFNNDGEVSFNDIDDLVAFLGQGEAQKNLNQDENSLEGTDDSQGGRGGGNQSNINSSCGNGIVEGGEMCEQGDTQLCIVNGSNGVRNCLFDCTAYNSSCEILEEPFLDLVGVQLFYEDCEGVNNLSVLNSTWKMINGKCIVNGTVGEVLLVSSKINFNNSVKANLTFDYDVKLGEGEYFEVDVRENLGSGWNEIFIVDGENSSGVVGKELENYINLGEEVQIVGKCNLVENSTGYCSWDNINITGFSNAAPLAFDEKTGLFQKLTGWIVKLFSGRGLLAK